MIDDLRTLGECKMQLIMKINFIYLKDSNKKSGDWPGISSVVNESEVSWFKPSRPLGGHRDPTFLRGS